MICQENRAVRLCRPRYNRLVEAESVLRVVFRLERAQPGQAPWLVAVDGFKRLVAFTLGVVHVRLGPTAGLAGVPEVAVLLRPRLGRVRQTRPGRNFAEKDPGSKR